MTKPTRLLWLITHDILRLLPIGVVFQLPVDGYNYNYPVPLHPPSLTPFNANNIVASLQTSGITLLL